MARKKRAFAESSGKPMEGIIIKTPPPGRKLIRVDDVESKSEKIFYHPRKGWIKGT